MACYRPIPALQRGTEPPRLWPPLGTANLELPCGKCIGCRTAKATEWAQRCMHEASLWESNTFVTLTYADEHLPKEGHLQPSDLTKFFKRLRKHATSNSSGIDSNRGGNIRLFACGEYGEKGGRPHYHALLFNCGWRNKRQITTGGELYTAEELERLWPFGEHRIGTATAQSAAYIAQYGLKKIGSGDCDADGVYRPAPFLRMSLKPGIGQEWVRKYERDLTHGYVVENNRKHGIPRFYQKKMDPMFLEEVRGRVAENRSRTLTDNNEKERRLDGEIIHKRRKELTEQRRL